MAPLQTSLLISDEGNHKDRPAINEFLADEAVLENSSKCGVEVVDRVPSEEPIAPAKELPLRQQIHVELPRFEEVHGVVMAHGAITEEHIRHHHGRD